MMALLNRNTSEQPFRLQDSGYIGVKTHSDAENRGVS